MRYCLPFKLRHGVMVESKQKLVLVGSATPTEGESNFVKLTDEVNICYMVPMANSPMTAPKTSDIELVISTASSPALRRMQSRDPSRVGVKVSYLSDDADTRPIGVGGMVWQLPLVDYCWI